MGLSRISKDKGDITTFQLLLELVQGINALSEDPKALKKAADAAYVLDAESEKKAQTAYVDITKAEESIREALKQQEKADSDTHAAETSKAEAKKLIESIKKEQKRISDIEIAQGETALKLSNQLADIKDRESKLSAGISDLNKKLSAYEGKKKELSDYESELKNKAAQLRSIVGA